jgi:hypothetical protein
MGHLLQRIYIHSALTQINKGKDLNKKPKTNKWGLDMWDSSLVTDLTESWPVPSLQKFNDLDYELYTQQALVSKKQKKKKKFSGPLI